RTACPRRTAFLRDRLVHGSPSARARESVARRSGTRRRTRRSHRASAVARAGRRGAPDRVAAEECRTNPDARAARRRRNARDRPPRRRLTPRRASYYLPRVRILLGVLAIFLCTSTDRAVAGRWAVNDRGECVREWTPSSIGRGPLAMTNALTFP